VWLYVLGIRTLVPPDEGRYAEMAREMGQRRLDHHPPERHQVL
jgi:4-amino-4-deoxy-L-arabinose transferase-like glycosyltransferase